MRLRYRTKLEHGLTQLHIAPLIDVIFLILMFFILSPTLTLLSGIDVKLPKTVTSDIIKDENLIVTITGEDVIHLNGRITTIRDLQKILETGGNKKPPILIKVDRRASVGRIVEVWNLCRNLGVEKINIATNQ